MEQVYTVKEFGANLAKILSLLDGECTQIKVSRGDKVYTIEKETTVKINSSDPLDALDRLRAKGAARPVPSEYGCECKKVEGKYLCPKHGRA